MFGVSVKLGKIPSVALALFVFLFLFQATPYARVFSHAVVHGHGIHHQHEGLSAAHSHQDHATGRVYDPLHENVPLILQTGLSSLIQAIPPWVFPLWFFTYSAFVEPDPPFFFYGGVTSVSLILVSVSYFISAPLRAPPCA